MNFLLGLIPNDYKWSVAIKKAAWTVAKTGIALLAGTKIGSTVSPDQWTVVTEASTALIAGGLKLIHDWARLKYPDVKWL